MRSMLIAATVACALSACSNAVPQDGFKQFKYGMSTNQLRAQGLECPTDDSCDLPSARKDQGQGTLFGHPAKPSFYLEGGTLAQIDVNVDIPQAELERQMRREFGSPQTIDYTSVMGSRQTMLLWEAGNGTSLSMTRAPEGAEWAKSIGSISYNGPKQTASYLDLAAKNKVKAGDV